MSDSAARFRRQKTKLGDLDAKIPELIELRPLVEFFPVTHVDCVSLLMHAEVAKYNNLLTYLKDQVIILQGCLDGETVFEPGLERTLLSILIDETPAEWLWRSFPSSVALPAFLANLQERVEYVKEVLEQRNPRESLWAFWLPGLFDQAHFFTALMQQEARRRMLPLDSLSLKYTVTDLLADEPGAHPGEERASTAELLRLRGSPGMGSWYIYGLCAHGAHWSAEKQGFEDIPAGQQGLTETLPAILVEVVRKSELDLISRTEAVKSERRKGKEKDPTPVEAPKPPSALFALLKTAAATASDPAVGLPAELCDADGNKYHETPLYVTKLRDRGRPGTLPAKCGSIPLRVTKDSSRAHWVKRGLALYCHDLE